MHPHDTITITGSAAEEIPAGEVTIPRELGPVRLLREIGRGGMGVVYLGRHQMLDRDVAVKFLLNAVAGPDDPGFARFLEGARAAAAVQHPGLNAVYHADVVENVPYLVMQYIDGPTLGDVLRRTGPLGVPGALALLDAVSEAIGELHDREIVHRDIKPANILLDREGRVVVTDFGLAIARPLGRRGPSSVGLAGTPAYMAPEMFAGEVSLRSDVYALGVMTFELLTGELPFTGTLEEVREKHLHEPLPLDPLQRRRVDPAMVEVLDRATHKNPMFRYKTAEYLRKALQGSLATEELLREGVAEVHRLVSRALDTEPDATTTEAAETTPTSTYFDRLAEIAEEKRATREPTLEAALERPAQADRAEPSPLPRGEKPAEVGSIPGPPSVEPARAASLTTDVPCVQCGYNLRGLPEGGRCPECGTPIARSLRGNLLSTADPAWLERVYRGQAVVCAGCLALMAHFVFYNVSGSGGSLGTWVIVHTLGASSVVDAVLEGVLSAAAPLLLLLGAFSTTSLDPRLSLTEQPIALRRFVRLSMVALVALAGSSYLVPTVAKQLGVDVEAAGLCRTVLLDASGLVFLSALVGICYYLAGLAMRMPDARLAARTRSDVFRFAGCVGIIVLMVVWAALTHGSGASAVGSVALWGHHVVVSPMFVGLILILALVAVAYCLSLMILMSAYRKAFRKCLLEARKHATATPPPRAETGDTGAESTT